MEGSTQMTTVAMNKLATVVPKATEAGKFAIIFDKQGNVETFMTYAGGSAVYPFHKEVLAIQLARKTKEDVIEDMRVRIVMAMRSGSTLAIGLDELRPHFGGEYTNDSFPTH